MGLSSFNPWAMQNSDGQWIGFEIDVATKLAKDMNLELELVPTAWAGIIPALLLGKFDIIIGGMSITPERAKQVTFSKPYEYVKFFLLLNKNINATSLESLNSEDYRFVGRTGSTPISLTRKLFPKAQLKSFDDDGLSIQDLLNGQADAFITTSIEAVAHLESAPELLYIPEWGRNLQKDDVAFALPKNVDPKLLDYVNSWIEENWRNKFLEEKSLYWFESRDWTKDHQLF